MRISDWSSDVCSSDLLSNRYIQNRFLPDKAIDLMDEAASRIRMEVESKPEEIEGLDRRIIQHKIEESALAKEADNASKDRLKVLREELANLEQKRSEEHTSELQSLMRISYAVFCLKTKNSTNKERQYTL